MLLTSTIYHTLRCVSPELDSLWLRLDVSSIMFLIVSSFYMGMFQG